MSKPVIKHLFHLGGFEVKRYNRSFNALFKKYQQYTMIPEHGFVHNLQLCEAFRHIEGDFVECGVWRGGMSAAIAEVLGKDRQVHLFDSFEGLPPAKPIDGETALAWQRNTDSESYHDNCAAEESFAREALALADHERHTLYRGWFDSTLHTYPKAPIAILRLDGDWYDSIMTCLEHLFPLVVPGGIVIVDDYELYDGCTRAVHDYLSRSKSPSRIRQWRDTVAYILKQD